MLAAGAALSATPSHRLCVVQSSSVASLALASASFGHHRAACSRAGVLGRRGFAVESVGARIFREAGARVATNVLDLDLLVPNVHDGRRLEIVAEGLPLFGVVQLVVDTTLVSPLRGDGSLRPNAAVRNGVALQAARRRKERTYPELVVPRARARLVVWAGEVGGRWSGETLTCSRLLDKAKSRSEPPLLRRPLDAHVVLCSRKGFSSEVARTGSRKVNGTHYVFFSIGLFCELC